MAFEMKITPLKLCFALLLVVGEMDCSTAATSRYVLENSSLARCFSIKNGVLQTTRIVNKRAHATEAPTAAPEFRLRLAPTNDPANAILLTASDFHVVDSVLLTNTFDTELRVTLTNANHELGVGLCYTLGKDDFFMRKRLTVDCAKPVILERIDVEALGLKDAYQAFTNREITSQAPSHWYPGLGQPLYTSKSGTFWGIEFPAADNQVANGFLYAGYLWGRIIEPGKTYQSYAAVMGGGDDPRFVRDAFFQYINSIRARPLRLRVQYNSWFEYGPGVDDKKFAASVAKINQELVVERGNPPLNAYTIDDGWENTKVDWSDGVWKVNEKFDPDFASSFQAVTNVGSRLGLWLSPGCLFGGNREILRLRAQGFGALVNSMSMADPRYMTALENRLVALTRSGVNFFKLDGLFGHLNTRDFDLNCAQYGVAAMPELPGFKSDDPRLNDPRYDEAKIYYLTAGTEQLMPIFQKLGEVDPNICILISNGAYLSPWWLMFVDDVWMINAGDAAGGANRLQQLVYRDGRYYDIWRVQGIQFPLCSVFNHEPKKTSSDESSDEFRNYLFMSLSRGTGFVELYLKPFNLQPADWDVLSEGLHWAQKMFPTFSRVRMHGGDPRAGDVYGYTAWTQTQGYISIYNPSDKPQTYRLKLDRTIGMFPGGKRFHLDSPLVGSLHGLPQTCRFGDSLVVKLAPWEIRIVDFDAKPRLKK
jgi:hypothetical protein